MTKTFVAKALSGLAAAALVSMLGFNAIAQEKKATTPPAKTETKAKTPKPPSPCKGLDETTCKGKNAECSWIAAGKTAAGKDRKAYCRLKAKAKTPAPK